MVLVGRAPDQARASQRAHGTATPQLVVIDAPDVSTTHVVVARTREAISLLDLGSRNGTWLRLPPGDPVLVHTSQPLRLRLAEPSMGHDLASGPEIPDWTGPADYERALVAAIAAWLTRLRVDAHVEVIRDRTLAPEAPRNYLFPIPPDRYLVVAPRQTVAIRWERFIAVLLEFVQRQNQLALAQEQARADGMVLASPAIRRVHREVVDAARSGRRLLLLGPTGAGKDGLARCYHRHTGRPGRFIHKNCGQLRDGNFARAEFFGSIKGAYTDASDRPGAVELADNGTLFLDEIGELRVEIQPQLLTFLDRGEYVRLGEDRLTRSADLALVSATNKDLRQSVADGEFREDLWYRIAGHDVQVPPLSERPEDVTAYLQSRALGGGVAALQALAPDAIALVASHAWRGNFRELQSFVARLPSDARPGSIDAATCREVLARVQVRPVCDTGPPARAIPRPSADLDGVAAEALRCYRADNSDATPSRWEDVKSFLERYWKPLACARLTGADQLARIEDARISELSETIAADRGTVQKHLQRYFERFRG